MDNPKYIDVRGARTRYYDAGDGDPVILVHGGHFGHGGSAEDWEHNFDALAQQYRVLAYDKLGMGFTDNPASDDDYVIDSHAAHLLGFMDALGVERAHLVGHSRGGYPVTRVALDHPGRLRTLTIVSSSSVTNPFNPVYNEWRQQANDMDERDAVRFMLAANSYSEDHITERVVDVGVEIDRLPKTAEARSKMTGALFERFRADMLAQVERVKADVAGGSLRVPTLVMWGFDDPSATVERCMKPAIDLFFPAVAECEMHILGHAGHYCFREQPAAFDETLLAFIARHDAAGEAS